MEELSKLGSNLKRKRNSIPRAVNYWLYFKHHFLEKPEVRTCFQKDLSYGEFRRLVKTKANPLKFGPSFCRRRTSRTNKRNIDDLILVIWEYYLVLLHPDAPIYVSDSKIASGLGIFLKQDMVRSAKEGSLLFEKSLFGVSFEVDEAEF